MKKQNIKKNYNFFYALGKIWPNFFRSLSLFIKSKSFLKHLVIILYRISLKNSDEIWFTNNSDLNDFVTYKIISPTKKTKIVPGCGVSSSFFYP